MDNLVVLWLQRLGVERGFEAYPRKGVYNRAEDLNRVEVRNRLRREILSSYARYYYFGFPCRGWAQANKFNGGMRRRSRPDGGESPLPREKHANFQASYVIEFCLLLHALNGWFTIESRLEVIFGIALSSWT